MLVYWTFAFVIETNLCVLGSAVTYIPIYDFYVSILKVCSSKTGEGNGTPLQYSCLENPMGGGAWWTAVHGVAKSWTQLSDFTFTFHFHALEKEMATHSSVLAWRIPGMGEPGGLPSLGSHRVGHDWSNFAAVAAATPKHHDECFLIFLLIGKQNARDSLVSPRMY